MCDAVQNVPLQPPGEWTASILCWTWGNGFKVYDGQHYICRATYKKADDRIAITWVYADGRVCRVGMGDRGNLHARLRICGNEFPYLGRRQFLTCEQLLFADWYGVKTGSIYFSMHRPQTAAGWKSCRCTQLVLGLWPVNRIYIDSLLDHLPQWTANVRERIFS